MSKLTVHHTNGTDGVGGEYEIFELNLKLCNTKEITSEEYNLFGNTIVCRIRFNWAVNNIKIFTQLKSLNGVISPYKCTILGADTVASVLRTDNSWRLTGSQLYICDRPKTCYFTLSLRCCAKIPFGELYDDIYFTDFDLFGEDNNVKAVSVHRNVLAVSSPVLKSMLLGDWKESKQGHVQSPGVSEATLQHFKDYIYLRKIPENPLDYAKLFSLASFYMIFDLPYLSELGVTMMSENFNPNNFWEWCEYCVEHKDANLLLLRLKDLIDNSFSDSKIADLKKHFSTNFKNPAYYLEKVQTLNSYCYMYDDTDFTDFQLCVEGEVVTVPAHRNVLAAFSPVLETKLQQEWKDAKQGYVPLVSTATVQQFKDYIYLKRMPESRTDCVKLLALASRYEMPELERDAAIKIAGHFKPENAWELLEYCMKNKADYLLMKILENIKEEKKIPALEEYFSKP